MGDLLTKHPNISIGDIENNPNLYWQKHEIGLNRNITLDYFKKQIPLNYLSFAGFLSHTQLDEETLNFIDNIISHDRSGYIFVLLEYLSLNPNLNLNIFRKYKDLRLFTFNIYNIYQKNDFLYNNDAFCKSLRKDISKRRGDFLNLKIYGQLNSIIKYYIGYK